jgi:hypothetical protein
MNCFILLGKNQSAHIVTLTESYWELGGHNI